MNAWTLDELLCGAIFFGIIAIFFGIVIIGFIGFVIDRLRERKELRRMLCEKYIQYRIFRWNHKGY